MSRALPARRYQGAYLIGFLVLSVAAMRVILFYQGRSRLVAVSLLAIYGLLYTVEPLLSARVRWFRLLYFPLQTGLVLALANLRPISDFANALYIPLSAQALHTLPRRAALAWMILFAALVSVTLVWGLGWAAGLAQSLIIVAGGGFMVSYDLLYSKTQADQAESQALLAELEQAHQTLQEYATQAEELAAARERNRLARELHDSVSQVIFSVTLTSQAARLLLERDPARVPEQLERLQDMTGSALGQLRSLIAQLRPPQNPSPVVRPETYAPPPAG
jgi:signal transduction histidine kinase